MNIAALMVRSGRAFSTRPAIAKGTKVLCDYAMLSDRVARLAFSLTEQHALQPGDRVALALYNCPEYIELLYACWHAGLVAVPINAKLHHSEFDYIFKNSESQICFTDSKLIDTIAPLVGGALKRVVEVGSDEYKIMTTCEPLSLVHRAPEDPAWLFYTSGTTGQPKGAVLSHRNLLAMCFCYFADVDNEAPWQAILHAAPISHGSGLYGLAHVMQASCHVIPESAGFEVDEIYSLIQRYPGLVFFAAPTMVKRLLDHTADVDTSNLKTIIYGGGPMYVEDCLAGLERFGPKLAQLYGQGETPMTITALNTAIHGDKEHPRWMERLASVGIAQSAVQVCVAGEDDKELPVGEVGEVLVRGDTVMNGYWKNPEATADTLRNGWLHTGDYGVFDQDGFLTLKDRAKDLIISGGTNIYPREVEEVLLKHPAIAEVSIIGRPHREWGEEVVAYIVSEKDEGVDAEQLEKFCIDNMARFKRPKDYRFVDALPKNNYGKVLKKTLREMEQKESQ